MTCRYKNNEWIKDYQLHIWRELYSTIISEPASKFASIKYSAKNNIN